LQTLQSSSLLLLATLLPTFCVSNSFCPEDCSQIRLIIQWTSGTTDPVTSARLSSLHGSVLLVLRLLSQI
jgi:hypothetical protein